ncbi:MAG: ATP-dependent DNA helicase [Alphaproteobacteria bacterium]|nr:ATP-dependent DNA helicase [Alphaproteobacteria bacterium]
MDRTDVPESRANILNIPVFVTGLRQGAVLTPEGNCKLLPLDQALARLRSATPIICHRPALVRRLGLDRFAGHDVLELFAFVRPAEFCVPTPRGLAATLDLPPPETLEDQARILAAAAGRLLDELAERDPVEAPELTGLAAAMDAGGWSWAPHVLSVLGARPTSRTEGAAWAALEVWRRLDEWSERAPEPPPANQPVEPAEARRRLADLLGPDAELRPQQADFASAAAAAFTPRDAAGSPHMVLAEAGTGVGKTLGYIAPATLWAARNRGAVWFSTYTRNLQHQIDQELDRAYPEAAIKRRKVVVRKGRENYFCLLNFEDAARAARLRTRDLPGLGLIARWAAHTRSGELIGGDFPGWLADLVGRGRSFDLADQRGECIHSACSHYQKCFIEGSIRRARRAEIVVANHALVMVQAALGGGDDRYLPTRYVFDEGHHLFDAADSAFSAHLSGLETADLRRWLRGAEGRRGSRSRARGLKLRLGELVVDDPAASEALEQTLRAAASLPGEGWLPRLAAGQPQGAVEAFLERVRAQVYARARHADGPYSIETETVPPLEGLLDTASALHEALARLERPATALAERLARRLDEDADALDSGTRQRIEAICRGLVRRAISQIAAWRTMLEALATDTPVEFVDWFSVERDFGRDSDVGMHRRWLDPTQPFAEHVAAKAHGVLVTSATLRDGSGDAEADWQVAEARTGACHLPTDAMRADLRSPFDYPGLTRVFVITDVRKDDLDQVAAAYRELFVAAGGGALGLFTAIARLRATHERVAGPLDQAGLNLLAQHVDGLDTSTLVDIFRAEPDSCMLGTDAVRDGVDIPGRSLRLIVLDRVPWSRPDILHRARREAFGGRSYDDMITRLRIKQAYGRLVRRTTDHGVFVLLDAMMPSRLAGAFPEGVEIRRLGLAEAVAETRTFLSDEA